MKLKNKYEKNTLANKVPVIACLSVVLGLVGCQQEGTAEKAGQKIDRAAENAQQKIEQTTEKTAQKIEAAKESLDHKVEKAKETINESTDASKGALESTGKKLDQATEKAGKELEGAKQSVIDKAATTGEYFDDSVITVTVKAAILNDPILSASHIEVTTVNGVVKLSGTVDSEQAIGRAMEVANSQKNVKSVQTDLIVNATSPGK